MKFYLISNSPDPDPRGIQQLFARSCEERSIPFELIDVQTFDFSNPPRLEKGDALYRETSGNLARRIELTILQPDTITLYQTYERAMLITPVSFIRHEKEGLPIPKTISYLANDKVLLKRYAEYVGGFPLIIKAIGGSHGIGVMKIDSLSSLYSVMDYLATTERLYAMRQFIDVKSSARLIVLGSEVIDMIEYTAPSDDFRSNHGRSPNVQVKKFPDDVQQTAIRATHVMGLEFGGVDILIDSDGKHYITEVNFPCYFPRCQNLTGTDISGMILEYFQKKSDRQKIA